jgi:hypothetical protein
MLAPQSSGRAHRLFRARELIRRKVHKLKNAPYGVLTQVPISVLKHQNPRAALSCCARHWLAIAGMLEVASGVLGTDRRKRFTQRPYQSVLCAGSCFTQHTLDLAERFLYGEARRFAGGFQSLQNPCKYTYSRANAFLGFSR